MAALVGFMSKLIFRLIVALYGMFGRHGVSVYAYNDDFYTCVAAREQILLSLGLARQYAKHCEKKSQCV